MTGKSLFKGTTSPSRLMSHKSKTAFVAITHLNINRLIGGRIYLVPTPFFSSPVLLAASSPPLSLSLPARRLNAFHSSAKKSLPFFSVMRFFNHSFWVCNCPIFCSNCAVLSLSSLAVFSSACSRCFFLTRKRADAAVFRRRLSSSAARRDGSSWPRLELGEAALAGRLLPGAGDGSKAEAIARSG